MDQTESIECIIDEYRNYSSHCILSDEINSANDYVENNDDYKNIFDVITSTQYGSYFEYNSEYNVITKINNYDYGLPGSGLLIWHIQEPHTFDIFSGMNNNVNNYQQYWWWATCINE